MTQKELLLAYKTYLDVGLPYIEFEEFVEVIKKTV